MVMSVPIATPHLTQPLSLTEAMQQWQGIDAQKQQMKLGQMQIEQHQAEQPYRMKKLEAESGKDQQESELYAAKAQQQKAVLSGGMAKQWLGLYQKRIQETGVKPGTPEAQTLLNQTGSYFAPNLAKLHGVPYDPNAPISLPDLESLAAYKGSQEYHPPVGTNQGTLQFSQNGWEPIQVNGQVAMPVNADPVLHAQMSAAKQGQQNIAVDLGEGGIAHMPAYQANPNFQNLAPGNNPGNLRPQGQSEGFQQFQSPQAGIQAIDRNLQAYGKMGINTLEGVISRWSPPNENNTAQLIAAAAKRLGISPTQPINLDDPVQRHLIAGAIMQQENPVFKKGGMIVGQTTAQKEQIKADIENQQKINAQKTERSFNADTANTILQRAEPLLDVSTHSGIGALVDDAMGFLGSSTKGADAASALKVLGARLTLDMPKMSGPQSDRDVQLYKEEAGMLGDPTVPTSRKRKALQEIKALNDKYGSESNKASSPVPAKLTTEDLLKKYGG